MPGFPSPHQLPKFAQVGECRIPLSRNVLLWVGMIRKYQDKIPCTSSDDFLEDHSPGNLTNTESPTLSISSGWQQGLMTAKEGRRQRLNLQRSGCNRHQEVRTADEATRLPEITESWGLSCEPQSWHPEWLQEASWKLKRSSRVQPCVIYGRAVGTVQGTKTGNRWEGHHFSLLSRRLY